MPILAGIIGTLITGLASSIAWVVGMKLAMVIAGIAIITAAWAVLASTVQASLAAIYVSVPGNVGDFLFILPTNFDECVGAYITVRVGVWAFGWHSKFTQLKLF